MKDKVLKSLEDTQTYERLMRIKACYGKLERRQKEFCACFNIHCTENCGSCCEHFSPDVTAIEADFLAYGLIKEGKEDIVLELVKSKPDAEEHCPLYIKNSVHHCSVYKWRPLICRLFGAAASKNKNGEPTFRKCKWNELGHDITPEEFAAHKKAVVLMGDFGEMLENIDPDNSETELLTVALPKAVAKIQYMLELERQSKE